MTYTVAATVAPAPDATLVSLLFDVGTLVPEFSSATTEYSLVLPLGTDAVEVRPFAAADTSTITVQGVPVMSGDDSEPIALPAEVTVVCTAADGVTQMTYTVAATVV